ncbi:MAG: hypothetical protein RBT34_00240 [Anaerolineaceae bacterium]|nr:hypothetical protein [Anaerolineaceae bacterium]
MPHNIAAIFKDAGPELTEISAKWETHIAYHEDEAMDWFIALYEELEVSNISDDPKIVDLADMLANMLSGGHIKMIDLGKNNAIQLWNEIPWNYLEGYNEPPLWDLALRFFKNSNTPMMACGHAANATDDEGNPVCVLCIGLNSGARNIAPTPDLTSRMAKCTDCSQQAKSTLSLAFFNHTLDKDTDSYYCGCRGWN